MKKIIPVLQKSLILLILAISFAACQLEVPVQEMTDAKAAINAAKAVDADKHSPEEIKKAEDYLLQCNEDLKNEKADDAKASALLAIESANKARTKALPLYAQERMTAAEEAYNEADKLYAAKFSPDNLQKAGELKNQANEAFNAADYMKAAGLAEQSTAYAKDASADSMKNSSALESELSDAGSRLMSLKNDEMAGEAQVELKAASDALVLANEGMTGKDFRKAYSELDNARAALTRAENKIKKKKLGAEITTLRAKMDQIKSGKDGQAVAEDLDKAMLELNAAETSLEQDNIDDASMRVASARELIAGTDTKLKKGNAAAALDKAESMLASAKEKDSGNKYGENLGRAETLIKDGRGYADQGKYNEAISSADEAETIIAAVLNSIESGDTSANVSSGDEHADGTGDTTADEGTASDTAEADGTGDDKGKVTDDKTTEAEKQYYVVQWRKKDTDCLWRIALKVYNDASLWPLIYVANRDQIKNPDLIFPGQKFIIPPKPEKKPNKKELKEMLKKDTTKDGGNTGK